MIYSNGEVVKSHIDRDYDSLYKTCMESYVFTLKNYNESLTEVVETEAKLFGHTSLNEAFNLKNFFAQLGQTIKTVFTKIIEVCQTIMITIKEKFYSSDQLIAAHIDKFKKRVEKYGKMISYDILMPNPSKNVFGSNGSEYSNQIVTQVDKIFIDFVNSKGVDNSILDKDIEAVMNELRGKICDKDSLTSAELKSELEKTLLVRKSGTGISQDIVNHVIKTMNLSPEALKSSWTKTSQSQMKEMLKTINRMSKVNENKVDENSFMKMKAYINGSLHIINTINIAYVNANIKLIREARKLFLYIMQTVKMPDNKDNESTEKSLEDSDD